MPPTPPPGAAANTGGKPVVRLLSRQELRNALEDLFGAAITDADLPYADIELTGLASPPTDFMGATDFDKLDRLTQTVAGSFVGKLQGSSGRCADAGCVDGFLAGQGRRVFRRPLEVSEIDVYRKLHAAETARKGHDAGLTLALAGLLQSPNFLYRTEIGVPAGGGLARLGDWEYASALSFLLTRSVPDDALLSAAGTGGLRTPDGVRAQVKRILAGKRGQAGVLDFYERWLGVHDFDRVEKDEKLFPTFDGGLRTAARRELTETIRREVFAGGGSFRNLLTTRKGFVDAKLAAVYGVKAPAQPGPVDLDATRAGLLTQVAFLAGTSKENDTDPFHAGKVLFDQVLCQPFPPPPEDPFLIPFQPDPARTRRQNLEARTAGGNCLACHRILNAAAFAFDAYDPIGRARTTLDGKAIDPTGALTNTRDANGRFAGVPEMMRLLEGSAQVSECQVKQWLRYGLGRLDDDADRGSVERAHAAFAAAGYDVLTMVTDLVLSDSFVYRKVTR